ncbi:uncharacterized protein E0L32_011466 [Thyridium curvatum]|uniref:DUF6590 domain-containing protein n=1 Tax=Thyridium curvatum TaxID=1093900 RepID=A0A507BNK9_9PEZI|nr:uncharacterized protein E0L32_011466 [Thyridium curvatum]TPX18851.1 hypothetical protein E0L32_011466 [Thyridium curvatum]
MKERSSSVASNHTERERGKRIGGSRPAAGSPSRVEKSYSRDSSSRSNHSTRRPQYTTTSRAEVSARESRDIRRSISTASRRPTSLRNEVLINEGRAVAARQQEARTPRRSSVSAARAPASATTAPAGLALASPTSPGNTQLPFYPYDPSQFPSTPSPQPLTPTTPRPGSSSSQQRRPTPGDRFAELRRTVRRLSAQVEASEGKVLALHRTSDRRHDRRDYFLGQIMSIPHHSQAGSDDSGMRTPINGGECSPPEVFYSPVMPSSPASSDGGGAFSPVLWSPAWSRRSSVADGLPPWDPARARNSVSFLDASDPHCTATGFGTVHSKYRKVVVVGVYATHVTALPIYTYSGRGAARLRSGRRNECVSIRDVDDANPEPAETAHGTLYCEKDAGAPCGRFVVQGLSSVHLTEPITHRYDHEATFEGRMMEEDFERLLYLMNKICWPTQQDFRDQTTSHLAPR